MRKIISFVILLVLVLGVANAANAPAIKVLGVERKSRLNTEHTDGQIIVHPRIKIRNDGDKAFQRVEVLLQVRYADQRNGITVSGMSRHIEPGQIASVDCYPAWRSYPGKRYVATVAKIITH